jgi:DNA polymerase-3 subunit chi
MVTPRIDFYLANSVATNAVMQIACKLIEKAYARGHKVFVYCSSQMEAHALDELLWTYKEDSFIPHNLQGEGPEPPPPIQIGFSSIPNNFNDILLNLSQVIPEFSTNFRRILHIVGPDEQAKALSREHYKLYRSKQYPLFTHAINNP